MNGEIQNFVERIVNQYPMKGNVLEIGSLDICGSVRRWFTKDGDQKTPTERFPEYTGIDIVPGNLVDRVMDAHSLLMGWKPGGFDIIITTSQLEHDTDPRCTMQAIEYALNPGGWLILTVPSWRGEGPHDLHDYWRFMKEGVELLVTQYGLTIIELIDHVPFNDILCLARKLPE